MSSSNLSLSVVDSVLAGMVASYEVPVQAEPKLVRVTASKMRAKREPAAKNGVVAKAPSANGSTAQGMDLPKAGSLTAAEFILALRNAGKVEKTNEAGVKVMLGDSIKERKDQILAIAGFVGYSVGTSHGTQLDNARLKAQFILRPMKTESKVSATVSGFVAGMPNGTAKVVNDLQGRIRLATETMLDLEKQAETANETERPGLLAMASVESERISHMRRDLTAITGE